MIITEEVVSRLIGAVIKVDLNANITQMSTSSKIIEGNSHIKETINSNQINNRMIIEEVIILATKTMNQEQVEDITNQTTTVKATIKEVEEVVSNHKDTNKEDEKNNKIFHTNFEL